MLGLQGNIIQPGNGANDAYGAAWKPTTDEWMRLGTLAEYSVDYDNAPFSNIPEMLLTVQRQRARCLVADDLTVNAWLDADDSTKLANGLAADLSGVAGQVCVRNPEHWRKFEVVDGWLCWWVAPTAKAGWEYVPEEFIGAFPGSDDGTGKLSSVANADILVSRTLPQFRAAGQARGEFWYNKINHIHMTDIFLYITEYANWNAQAKIGPGLSNAASADWSAYNGYSPLIQTGVTTSLGNHTGVVEITIPNFANLGADPLVTQEVSYRGVEGPYAHLFEAIDAINIKNVEGVGSQVWVCTDLDQLASDTESGYKMVGLMAEIDGYGANLIPSRLCFIPSAVGGSSTTKLCDYLYTYFDNLSAGFGVDWRVVFGGGAASYGVLCGPGCVHSYYGSSDSASRLRGRLCGTRRKILTA
jgi:hypothetical protein